MRKVPTLLITTTLFFILSSCSIYTSSDRKKFETDTAHLNLSVLKLNSCSQKSLQTQAEASRLLTVLNNQTDNSSTFIWEHIVDNISYIESDNLEGVYCLYE